MPSRVVYRVQGLDCSEEVAILRREVGVLPGVINLEFDVVDARMSVEYDADAIKPEQIASAVDKTGMKASPWGNRARTKQGTFWEKHGRLVMAIVSGSLLLAGFILLDLAHFG